MRISVCPGTFDPLHWGMWISLNVQSRLFDHIYVAVLHNPDKKPLFTVQERIEMLEEQFSHLDNVTIESYAGLLWIMHTKRAWCDCTGPRAVTDFEFEFKLASMNSNLAP